MTRLAATLAALVALGLAPTLHTPQRGGGVTPGTAMPEAAGTGVLIPRPVPAARPTPSVASRSRVARPRPRGTGGAGHVLEVTAYCEHGLMANGHRTHPGAAAGNDWPFGTRLRVENVGVVTVEDRYGWGTQLDIWLPSCAQARAFGRRHLRVEVAR